MTLTHAVILAGGRGQRLGGVSKAQIRIGGVRLIDRVAAAMKEHESPLLVACGHSDQGAPPVGAISIADLDERTGGPLAGLAAVVEWLAGAGITAGLLVSVAVDTPFLPPDYISVMTEKLGAADSGYACWGDEFYPTNAVWRLSALTNLAACVRAGTAPRSLRVLIETQGGIPIDWRDRFAANPFANLNTPADLVALGRRTQRL